MTETTTEKKFYCLECNGQFAKSGDCPHCIDEPLLPIERTYVRSFIHTAEKNKPSPLKRIGHNLAVTIPVLTFIAGCAWWIGQLLS